MILEDLFTLIALKLGAPQPLPTSVVGGKKAPVAQDVKKYAFLQEFISLCSSNGHPINSDVDLKRLHARYEKWYETNLPKEHTIDTCQFGLTKSTT